MYSIAELTKQITRFRDERDWKQFHSPKNMMLSLLIEAGELAEHFQWRDDQELCELSESDRAALAEELADVLYWVLLLGHDLSVDLESAFQAKMLKNQSKYPVASAKGKRHKYSEL